MSEKSFAVVRQSDMNIICSAGPIYNPRMVISVDDQGHAQMEFQVFFRTMLKEAYSRQAADPHLESMLRESGYSVCPGIPEYPLEVCFKSKNYRKWHELLSLVSAISDIGKDELQNVLSEADKKGRGDILGNIWKLDVEERLKFQKDQKQNGNFK